MDGESLKYKIAKAAMLLISVIIGLLCGETLDAFYIAVLVQSLSNSFDSFEYIGDVNKLVTAVYVMAFFAAVFSFICAVLHFVTNVAWWTNQRAVVTMVCICLSIPCVIVLIDIFVTIKTGRY